MANPFCWHFPFELWVKTIFEDDYRPTAVFEKALDEWVQWFDMFSPTPPTRTFDFISVPARGNVALLSEILKFPLLAVAISLFRSPQEVRGICSRFYGATVPQI